MSPQNATCSSYRGMNFFNVIVGVAPKRVITYVSHLYPGFISDEAIVQQARLDHLEAGDMILADKGFLIIIIIIITIIAIINLISMASISITVLGALRYC